jgi:proton-coupled amino acid transporter
MGGTLYGPGMRRAILFSIGISQIGFVTAYIIFVSSNLNSLVLSLSKCKTQLSSFTLIFSQVILLLPLALVRNLAKLSLTALIADGFILVGLLYIWGSEIGMLVQKGPGDVQVWFNPKDYALLVGTAVFSFEGIGLIIPITDAMKEPHKFPKVLTGVMLGLISKLVERCAIFIAD